MGHAVDLDRYCERIRYDGPREPTLAVLEHLQSAHAASIPFENIDVVLGRRIDVDGASVEDKLVTRRRGGYCFEQNRLFADVLTSIGFEVTEVLARVRPHGLEVVAPRTHMTVCVSVDGADWLADVGFGASQPRGAVRLDGTARSDGWATREWSRRANRRSCCSGRPPAAGGTSTRSRSSRCSPWTT